MKQDNFYYIFEGTNEEWFEKINGIFKERAKLIYLDPPYNTKRKRGARKGYDDTNNDWENTMLKTLKKAYEYLHPKGFLAISINQTELFTLKNVLDEIFNNHGRCFVGLFPVKIRHKERQLMINATFHDVYEYLLIYRKSKDNRFKNKFKKPETSKFIHQIKIIVNSPIIKEINGKKVEVYEKGQYEIVKTKPSESSFRRYIIAGKIATANWSGEFFESHLRKLGDEKLIKVYDLEKKGNGFRWFFNPRCKSKEWSLFPISQRSRKTLPVYE